MCTISNLSRVSLIIFILVFSFPQVSSAQDGPDINVWYGDDQSFGQEGIPQPWVNILGNVSDANGVDLLYYTLNGGSNVTLSIGSDGRRLQSSGDFNVDLATSDLVEGANELIIYAADNLGNESQHTVNVDFASTNTWPLPYDIDWQAEVDINDVAQVVDGNWEVNSEGLHTLTTGYDRLVAIGDMTWEEYEVSVPITIHSMNNGNGVGILFRWIGHTDDPVECAQPKCGWLPLGGICWYRGNRIEIYGNEGHIIASQTRSLDLETEYIFKARVEHNPGVGGQYSFKVWEASETEPDGWDITGQESLSDPQAGSAMLISHHGDVTFGNVSVSPVPISITNAQAQVHAGNTSASISWKTNVNSNSQVAYGLTSAYELGTLSDPANVTLHSLDLCGLLPNTEYHYQITSETPTGDEAVTGDMTFTTVTSDIVSDDFHLPLLDTDVWTFVDPVGDCSYDLVGSNTADAWLNIDLPAGTEHQLWESGIQVPHVLQSCNDADFEVEVKFESGLSLPQYQEQGVLVRQDDDTFLRFEFFSRTTGTNVYAESFSPGEHANHANDIICSVDIAPLYMRVKRQNDQWTMTYSFDGVAWDQAAVFSFPMTVTGIGPYAGNAIGVSSPAHTGSIDYFFNTAAPVDPEDPINSGTVIITSEPVTTAVLEEAYFYDVDADGTPAATFELLTAPPGMTINSSSGLIQWTPDSPGDYDVSVKASNTTPSADIQNFTIHVLAEPWSAMSDDFNDPVLDEAIWSFVDPLGGGEYSLSGACTESAWLNISVPGGSPHELWTSGIQAPHILQDCNDTDFELEVKFESPLSGGLKEQGVLVKEDESNFLRFEFYSSSSNTKIIAVKFEPGSSTTLSYSIFVNSPIGNSEMTPLFMRVNRIGDQWTQSYSSDGSEWTVAVSFEHTLAVTAVGTYAGNYSSAPAHTSSVDYFNNNGAPIVLEDRPCAEWTGNIDEDWNKNGNWSVGKPDQSRNAIIHDVSGTTNVFPEINGAADCANLTIEPGATMDIGENGMLTIHGIFRNNGEITIRSDETGTGSLIDNGFICGSGATNIQRYLTDDKWHYISSPVDDPTAEVFLGMYMMEWDEPSGEWTYITDQNYVMNTDMQGFSVWTNDPGTVTFSGEMNTGTKFMNTTKSFASSHNSKGFNFAGNPFPSALDWNVDDGDGWSRLAQNIDPTLYIWNGTVGNYGVYVKDAAQGTNDVDNIIPPHQGFFVHCNAATGAIGVDNGARTHTSDEILKSNMKDGNGVLKLKVSGNEYSDEVILQINELSTPGFDNLYDGIKYYGSEEAPQIYSLAADEQKLSINSFPVSENYSSIPIGVEVGESGQYSISVESFIDSEFIDKIQLEDLLDGNLVTLNEGLIYNFSAFQGADPIRFHLNLLGSLVVDDILPRGPTIYSRGKTIFIELPENTVREVIIYNLMGQKIAASSMSDSKTSIMLDNAGCYIVSVISHDRIDAKKIVIR